LLDDWIIGENSSHKTQLRRWAKKALIGYEKYSVSLRVKNVNHIDTNRLQIVCSKPYGPVGINPP
jgi:hypothetical protein